MSSVFAQQPCLSGWIYSFPVEIDNSAGPLLTNYQVEVTLNTETLILDGKMQIDGDDIRVLDQGGSALAYWVEEESFNTDQSKIWIKVPTLAAGASLTVYIFYGNDGVGSLSNGENVFELFDDFNDVAIDGSTWTTCGTPSTNSGQLVLNSGDYLVSQTAFPMPHIIETWNSDFPANIDDGELLFGQFDDPEGYGVAFQQDGVFQSFRLAKLNNTGCFGFDEEASILSASAGETTGVWSFTWVLTGDQQFSWPGGNYSRSNTDFSFPSTSSLAIGNIDIASDLNFAWLRIRKYTPNEPVITNGAETVSVTNIAISNSGNACEGGSVTLSATEVSGASYSWEDDGGNIVGNTREIVLSGVAPSDAGEYTVTVTASGGCSSSVANTDVTVDATSLAGAIVGDAEVCFGDNDGQVVLSGNVGDDLTWESSLTGESPWSILDVQDPILEYRNLILTTFYRVKVSNGICPEVISNVVRIEVDTESDPGVLSGTSSVCEGGNSGTLTLSNFVGDVMKWQSSTNSGISWVDIPNTTSTLDFQDISLTTLFRTEVQDGVCEARLTDPFQVQVSELPVADFLAAESCAGDPLQFQNQSFITSGFLQSYFWEFEPGQNSVSASPTYIFDAPGSYDVRLIVTSNNLCSSEITKTVTVNEVPAVDFEATATCDGEITNFTDLTTLSVGNIIEYSWQFGDGTVSTSQNPQKQYFNPGTYVVTLNVTSDRNCTQSMTKGVVVDPLPVANFDVADACLGERILINNTTFFSGSQIAYAWDFGNGDTSDQTNPEYSYPESGVYQITLTATTDQGCVDAVSRSLTVIDYQGVSAGEDATIDNGSSIQLTGSGAQSYSWSPNETLSNAFVPNPIATPSTTTTYFVVGTNFLGCTDTDSVTIIVNENFDVSVNNVLTPNGDGVNDTWEVTNIDTINDPVVQVFDRNGVEVFFMENYNNSWEGTRGSDLLPDGTYYYIISSKSSNALFKGALTILRNDGE
ncbi:MAG: DUF2341 domain-containing protein [Bacteroidota bacterium]